MDKLIQSRWWDVQSVYNANISTLQNKVCYYQRRRIEKKRREEKLNMIVGEKTDEIKFIERVGDWFYYKIEKHSMRTFVKVTEA